jgi:hypothetical protein
MYGFFSRTNEDDSRLAADPNYVGRKDWGIGLVDFTAQVEIRGNLASYVEQLSSVDVARLNDLGATGNPDPDTLKAAMVTVGILGQFKPSTDFVTLSTNVGVLNTRILHVGLGARMFSQGFVSVADLDTVNIGFGQGSAQDIVADINANTPDGFDNTGYTPSLITGTAAANLATAMAAASGLPSNDASILEAINRLDYAAQQAGMTSSDIADIAGQSTDILPAAIAASTGVGTDINDNTSALFVGGVGWAEVPLTIGYALNDHLSVGGSAKLMIGQVAATKVRLMGDTDEVASYLQDAMEDSVQSVTGGLDLGFVARAPYIQFGLTGRNLNSPVFKGGEFTDYDGNTFEVDDVKIQPQFTAGLALYPFETFCITGDLDLNELKTTLKTTTLSSLGGLADGRTLEVEYKSRRAGVGAEWNILRFLALRGGAYKNIADEESALTYTAGLGINLWLMRLDLAGSMASETVTIDGEDIPKSVGASAALTIDF